MVQLIAPEILSKSFLVSELNHGLFIQKDERYRVSVFFLLTCLSPLLFHFFFDSANFFCSFCMSLHVNIHRWLIICARYAYSNDIDCDDCEFDGYTLLFK